MLTLCRMCQLHLKVIVTHHYGTLQGSTTNWRSIVQLKCISKIAKGKKGTQAPTYRGRKEEYGTKCEIIVDFWFCWDDIQQCVKGTKQK